MKRGGWLVAGALLAGALFCSSLGVLWPLAPIDLVVPERQLVRQALGFLEQRGFLLGGYDSAEWLRVDAPGLDYVERAFGKARADEWIRAGLPLYEYRVAFKRAGDPLVVRVSLHPDRGALGWTAELPRDLAGERLDAVSARTIAQREIEPALGLDLDQWQETSFSTELLPARVDHRLVYERQLVEHPELRERLSVVVAGDRVATAVRSIVVPPSAERQARRGEAASVALESFGFLLLGIAAAAAFVVFLRRISAGEVRLGRAAGWPVVVFVCFTVASVLDSFRLFLGWDPLWPRAVSAFRDLLLDSLTQVWVLLVLLAVVAAGDALDRASGANRGRSLWLLARGRVADRSVALASGRGFLIGLACGGVMASIVVLLHQIGVARSSIQPRGFFFYPLNSEAPAITTLLFFFGVSLAEELGYRFFGGTWLEGLTRRRWLAVVVPALVYGLTHTGLDFLPPAEPFWARPLVLTAVGCVWGWAFLRYDALTVVLSHFTADLFIFNWPRLASGEPTAVTLALVTIGVPLLPALAWPWIGSRKG
ncbi:MAG TPA: CPBP family intramembrane glutamic endopeptidase [Candidatus Polarisedimenticolaceae bacterium]|nr:CPBP family intramembrane glutamic endopeptidase [Candidatus Polarisedimenticolaceae bacterium]